MAQHNRKQTGTGPVGLTMTDYWRGFAMPLIAGSNHGNLVGNLEWSKHCGRKRRYSRITAQQHSIMSHTFEEKKHQQEEKQQLNSHGEGESIDVISSWIWKLRKLPPPSLTIKEEKESSIQVERRARATIGSGTEKLDTVCVPALDLYQGRQGWRRWKNHHFTTTFAFHHSRSTSNKPLTINRKFKTSWSIGCPPPHIWVWTFSWIQTMMVKIGCSFATQYINLSHGSSRHLNQQSGRTVPHMENHPYGANPGGREISEDSSYRHVGSGDRERPVAAVARLDGLLIKESGSLVMVRQRAHAWPREPDRHVDDGPQQWRTGAP